MEDAKSLDRALQLLFELARHPGGLSASELARRLETQRPPLYRPLRTLMKHRIIHKDDGKLYHLGIGLLELADAAVGSIAGNARRAMQPAADELGNTVMLLVEEGGAIVTLASAQPSTPGLYLDTSPGFIHPDGPTAPRLVLQALRKSQPEEPSGVTRAREEGYSVTLGVGLPDRTAVAVGVLLGATRRPGALLVVGGGSLAEDPSREVGVLQSLARALDSPASP